MVSPAQSRLTEAELAPAAIGTAISSAIAVKTQDAQKQQGAAVLQLLDRAAEIGNPAPGESGGFLDIRG